MAPLVVLHFSDLHFGPHSRFADQDPARLGPRFAREVEAALSEAALGGVDLLIVTGDVTEAARKSEFAQASRFFASLVEALEIPRERVCFVPGNHDVSWALCKRVRADQEFEEFDDAELERRLHADKLGPWRTFVAEFYGPHASGRRPLGPHAFVQDFDALRVSVASLDSCTRETDRVHGGYIGPEQAQAVLDEWNREERRDWLSLIAVHHNPVADVEANIRPWVEWLGEQAEAKALSRSQVEHFAADAVGFTGRERVRAIAEDSQAQLVLHGHVHAAGHTPWSWRRARGQTQVVGAGSLALHDNKLPGDQPMMFQLLVLDAPERELRIIRRVWEPRARMAGNAEPGTFVADPATPRAGVALDVGVPKPALERLARAAATTAGDARAAPATPAREGPVSDAELARYLSKAAARHEFAQLLGFTIKARLSLQLEDLYIPLDAVIDRQQEGSGVYASVQLDAEDDELDALMDAKLGLSSRRAEQLPLARAFTRADELGRRGLVLLGDPGSGKTTHLQQVLLKVVRDGPESLGLPAKTVPVFLALQALTDPALDAGLPAFIQDQLRDPLLDMAPDFGERLCRRGGLLLLLDGLDEVADADQRARVARWIEDILRASTDVHVLVSCRYAGYADEAVLHASFLELHLRPLDDAKMEAFVRNWYALVEADKTHDADQARLRATTQADDLLAVLTGPEFTSVARVYEMTRNPLLLTAICLVHHDRGRMPDARAALYEDSIAVLLERWRKRETGKLLSADDALDVLRPIAAWMHGETGRKQASKDELLEPTARALRNLRGVELDAERFLRVIRDDSGLLTGWGIDSYGFMHLGFQEYLTARHLRGEGLVDDAVFAELAGRFDDSWWQEVILLMLALRDPPVFEPFMRAVVQRPEFPRWVDTAMMQLCLRETAKLSATPFLQAMASSSEAARTAVAKMIGRGDIPEALVLDAAIDTIEPQLRPFLQSATTSLKVTWEPAGVTFVRVPAGRFLMGSPPSEHGRYPDEGPQHEVELAEFLLATTPITNAQYGVYLAANPDVPRPSYWADRRFNQPEQPVVGISGHDAEAYCAWAGFVLPTEAQWEYACRAGTTTRYWSGDATSDLARVGWYFHNSGGRLHSVAELPANDFGLFDMHGNVDEWCRDAKATYRHVAPRPGDGLRAGPLNVDQVYRGGNFNNGARVARAAYRGFWPKDYATDTSGFRPVLILDE